MPPTEARDRRAKVAACKRRFRAFYPDGFHDADYIELERSYKWSAHRAWAEQLGAEDVRRMLDQGRHEDVARAAVRIESRTNLLYSFEKMAVRDAIAEPAGAKAFAEGLADWLHGPGSEQARFERWCAVVGDLPRRQTRVRTWPVVTVFGFLARPKVHLFLKPQVTKRAAAAYGFDLRYRSTPQWETYADLLDLGRAIRTDLAAWRPRDQIDVQSFLWVQGSEEYD